MHQLRDIITQPLYDTAMVAPGSTEFFAVPVGQGTTRFGVGAKHFGDTNMFLSGQVPAGQQFIISSIYAEPLGAPVEAGSVIELTIRSKIFLKIPTTRAAVALTVADAHAHRADQLLELIRGVDPAARAMLLGSIPGVTIGFDLASRALVLGANDHLGVRLVMPEDAPPRVVRIYLNGQLGRPVQ